MQAAFTFIYLALNNRHLYIHNYCGGNYMNHLLEFEHVSYSYHSVSGETLALSDISFTLAAGEFLAIVGPSGCGKSTLLNMICHLIEPEQGEILFQGAQLSKEAVCSIGYMLQKDHLFDWRSIERNVYLGLEIQKKLTPQTKQYAAHLLQKYGLYDFRHKKPSELSGGMRQRAALIRTLVLKPMLLLLDEPFSALDYQTRLNTANDIGSIIREEQKSAVMVTHDLSEAVSLADRILVLSSRPGRLKRILTISFPKEMTALERRGTNEFKDYFNMLWKEMNEDEESAYCAGIVS